MADQRKTKAQLMIELAALQQRVAELEAAEIERKQVEQTLRESEQRFQAVLTAAQIYLWSWDIPNDELSLQRYFNANPRLGTSASFLEQIHSEDRDKIRQAVSRTFEEGVPYQVMYRDFTPEGEMRWNISQGVLQSDELGRPLRLIGVEQDITEQKQAEIALRISEERYRVLIELMSDYAFSYRVEPDGTLAHDWNTFDSFQRITGYTLEEINNTLILYHPEDQERVYHDIKAVTEGKPSNGEYRIITKRGELRWMHIYRRPVWDPQQNRVVCFYGVAKDITERKELEEQLRQAQKMEAIGRLAGGVAHDFNNILTVIQGYTGLLLQELEAHHPLSHDISQIQKSAEQAAALTRQLLAFSRKQILQPVVLDFNAIVTNMDKMLRRLIGEDINLTTLLEPALGRVKVDPGLMEQVIMNLAINAREAMPKGGQFTIETANVELDEAYAHLHFGVNPGPYIRLTLTDTGQGMDAETRSHIFEPFFTTKEQGTGLGLATVHGIINQSSGHIWVYSEPGQGATFKIYLPRVEEEIGQWAKADLQSVTPSRRGSETILLVEDESLVRELACRALSNEGYLVLEAAYGEEAIRVAQQHQGLIDLLLTDVVMPGGMSGRQLVEYLTPLHQEMKVLYMSGYTDDAVIRYGILDAEAAFLQKPFTPDRLASKVRELLDAPRSHDRV